MTIEDIQKLITDDEDRKLEVKKSTGELKDGMHSACAFLNTDGGWLIFGITPKSLKILGEQVTDSTRREISEAISSLEPALDIRPEYIDVPGRPDKELMRIFHDVRACLNEQGEVQCGRTHRQLRHGGIRPDGRQPDAAKMRPACFDACQHVYRLMDEPVAKAFSCGKALKV